MQIKKRDSQIVDFEIQKIERAISKAFDSVGSIVKDDKLKEMSGDIVKTIKERYPEDHIVSVEEVQDLVELQLIDKNYYKEVKSYILYRAKHSMDRKVVKDFSQFIDDSEVLNIIQAEETGADIITCTPDLILKTENIGKSLEDFSLETVKMFNTDIKQLGYTILQD